MTDRGEEQGLIRAELDDIGRRKTKLGCEPPPLDAAAPLVWDSHGEPGVRHSSTRAGTTDSDMDRAMTAVAVARSSEDRPGESGALVDLGRALRNANRPIEARYIFTQAESIAYAISDRQAQENVLSELFNLEELSRLLGLTGGELYDLLHEDATELGKKGIQEFHSFEEARRSRSFDTGDDGSVTSLFDGGGVPGVELLVGFLAVKALGPFIEEFAKKLGEQLGESTAHAIGRIRLLRHAARRQQQVNVLTNGPTAPAPWDPGPGDSNITMITTLVLPDDFTDAAKLAATRLDMTADGVRGATLHWDPDQGTWKPATAPGANPQNPS